MRHRLYLLKHNKQKLGQIWKLEVELTFLVKLYASLKIFQNLMFFKKKKKKKNLLFQNS